MLGPDLYPDDAQGSRLTSFRIQTGATYPLLKCGACGTGNENLQIAYGQFDNYVVINKQGVIRYHAYDLWPHGNRYHLDEIRRCVDSLVTNVADVGSGPPRGYVLEAAPNPFRGTTMLELINPGPVAHARVTVHDVAGRLVSRLWDAPVAAGPTSVGWDGRSESGVTMGPGVYVVSAEVGGVRLTRRLIRVR